MKVAHGAKTHAQQPTSPRAVFTGAGYIFFILLCILPSWNAITLLLDRNYTFWAGSLVPIWMIFLCLLVIVLYVGTTVVFFRRVPQAQTAQAVMMIATVFVTLLGILLILISTPLLRQSMETYDNLIQRCDSSEQTHLLYRYSLVLQSVRALPGCSNKFSVEDCPGYKDAGPFTDFLKEMENSFQCSGFCYRAPAELESGYMDSLPTPSTSSTKPTNATMANATFVQLHRHDVAPSSLLSTATHLARQQPAAMYPPTLFSNANYQVSCNGMAAREIKQLAGDIGFQTLYQGILLVFASIAIGLCKLFSMCWWIDSKQQYKP